jgi:hypothetical protein
MKSLQCEKLNHYPLNLTHVADLLFFDGALLSLFEDKNKENYLYYWCDVDEICNRWLVFEVSSKNLRLYLQGNKSLYEIVTSPVNNMIYAIDMNNEGEIENIYKINPENLPEDYIPDKDSYYDFSELDNRLSDKKIILKKIINYDLDNNEMLDDYSEVLTESHLKSAVRGKYSQSLANGDSYTVRIMGQNEDRYVNMKTIEVEALVNNEGQLTVQVPSNLKEGQYHAVLIIEEPKNEN